VFSEQVHSPGPQDVLGTLKEHELTSLNLMGKDVGRALVGGENNVVKISEAHQSYEM
jgi:hypothetical protein